MPYVKTAKVPPVRRSTFVKSVGLAYLKGYRVLTDGTVKGPRGPRRTYTYACGPQFSVSLGGKRAFPVRVAALLAFQLWGETAFREGVRITFRDGDNTNVTARNLFLTTAHQSRDKRKLTDEQVRAARKAWAFRQKTVVQIAREYGMGRSNARAMLLRQTYADVEMRDHTTPLHRRPAA